MKTHSSILAWEILWTEEPSRLQSMGSQRVRHSSESKEPACNVGDSGLIPGSVRSPGEGNGNPLQYSRLENPTDGEAW